MTPREVIEDFLKWIKEPGRVDSWDQEFFETWMNLYIKDKEDEG